MSIKSQAIYEMKLARFPQEEIDTMTKIMDLFFEQWDSGGAVSCAAPVLTRLLCGLPLSPLSGVDEEWNEVGPGVFQNKRCSSVFKDPRFHNGEKAYDLDNPRGPRAAIQFPYYPPYSSSRLDPVMEVEV